MKFNIADLPAVRAQLERDIAAAKDAPKPVEKPAAPAYARAPAAAGGQAPAQRGAR